MTSSPVSTIEQCWRWFGPADPIPLAHIKQAGATGVVSALYDQPNGAVWPVPAIRGQVEEIERAGLRWSVVESVPVHEHVKQATGDCDQWLMNYAQTLRNLAACGVKTVCYNFMPLLDWTRTELSYRLPSTALALRFDFTDAAVFDLFTLGRAGAATSYTDAHLADAQARFEASSPKHIAQVARTILMGLPGTVDDLSLDEFRALLTQYDAIDAARLRENHAAFFARGLPPSPRKWVSGCASIPTTPPFALFGLPKIASVAGDFAAILAAYDSPANGITFCSGSLGAHPTNDLPALFCQFGHRVHFLHLRNVTRSADGSFYEADHLGGDVPMPSLMAAILDELDRRDAQGETLALPMRPDHGHLILDDQQRKFYAGYSAIGRLRGLAELRGLEAGLRWARGA